MMVGGLTGRMGDKMLSGTMDVIAGLEGWRTARDREGAVEDRRKREERELERGESDRERDGE